MPVVARFLLLIGLVYLANAVLAVALAAFALVALAAVGPSLVPAGLIGILVILILCITVATAVGALGTGGFILGTVSAGTILAAGLVLSVGLVTGVSTPLILLALAILGLALNFAFFLWFTFGVHRVPMALVGLGGLKSIQAFPFCLAEFPDTISRLLGKFMQRMQPKNALTTVFTLGASTQSPKTAPANTFLFGSDLDRSYSLDEPEQFTIGWTNHQDIAMRSAPLAALWAQSLRVTGTEEAQTQFWPTLAKYSGAFNIWPLKKLEPDSPGVADIRKYFGSAMNMVEAYLEAGLLYCIDMTIFEKMIPPTVKSPRFTPSTFTLLVLDRDAKTLTPILIRVSNGRTAHIYSNAPQTVTSSPPDVIAASSARRSTWLYAIQAAKTSLTVWGIWLGHVHKYHVVTAAMQMTMFQTLPPLHPVRQIFGRQSDFLIGFDQFLFLIYWDFAPPTSFNTSSQCLKLMNEHAANRDFFRDDPRQMIADLGLNPVDFTDPTFKPNEIADLPGLVTRLKATPLDAASAVVVAGLPSSTITLLAGYGGGDDISVRRALINDLNALIRGPLIFDPVPASLAPALSTETLMLLARTPPVTGPDRVHLNRLLLQDAFMTELVRMSNFNLYPVARCMLKLYAIIEPYISRVVDGFYADDASVLADKPLQAWIVASADPNRGNVQGLPLSGIPPQLTNKNDLKRVLTSLIYRITAHGISRMEPIGNPGLTFMSNYPPCLQDSRLPDPDDPNGMAPALPTPLTTRQLLTFLPNTGSIGDMLNFIFGFVYTDPYVPFIPVEQADLSGAPFNWEVHPYIGPNKAVCDGALDQCRADLRQFIHDFAADSNDQNLPAHMRFQATPAQIHQWELNIET